MAIGTFREWLREGKLNEAGMPQDILDILSKYGFSEKTRALKNYLKDKNSEIENKIKRICKSFSKRRNY